MKGPQANQTSQEPGRQNDTRPLKKLQKLQLVKLFPEDNITSNTHWVVRSDTEVHLEKEAEVYVQALK